MGFSEEDRAQIAAEGLTPEQVQDQIRRFRAGMRPLRLNRPCRAGDGIVVLSEAEGEACEARYEEAERQGRIMKFVPASGAASRMFRDWYRCLEAGRFDGETEAEQFSLTLPRYAFYGDLAAAALRRGANPSLLLKGGRQVEILAELLTERGLGYGAKPKALLAFHAYADGVRTPLEEHLVEAALYARDGGGGCRIHFTVSEEHERDVAAFVSRVRPAYERRYGVSFEIGLSIQRSATKTIAVDLENRPFRNPAGRLVFRPGGHGALLGNLDRLGGDIVLIKNIDNVVPDRLKPLTVRHKKRLGGYLLALQDRIFSGLRRLAAGTADRAFRTEMAAFCRTALGAGLPPRLGDRPAQEQDALLFHRLNRPLRVCGMVRNEGEPGGGPFWVHEADGTPSLQIVEEFQVDRQSPEQRALWEEATHFNPVDLVCGLRDWQGRSFPLADYVDAASFCISRKSERGRDIQALELPGLWNGSMALWNTVFVEVPIETFNPVKTVEDLLRPQHQPA